MVYEKGRAEDKMPSQDRKANLKINDGSEI